MILGRLLLHYVHRKLTARTVHHSKNPKCDFFTAQLDVVLSNKSKTVSLFPKALRDADINRSPIRRRLSGMSEP